jgi:hypothetical protein
MSPRLLVRILGLCNVVAGALLMFAPRHIAPVDGMHTTAATLMARSAAVLLIAVAIGARWMPGDAARPYLWTFGVGVKLAGAIIWAAAAVETGVAPLWTGAAVDAGVAAVVALGLLQRADASS